MTTTRAGDPTKTLIVIGVGNRLRGDDAAGLEVAERIRELRPDLSVHESDGDTAQLMDLWSNASLAIVVDAVQSESEAKPPVQGAGNPPLKRPPSRVVRFDFGASGPDAGLPLPAIFPRHVSSHSVGLAESIEMGAALGMLPERMIVYGIEGRNFAYGAPVDPSVEQAIGRVTHDVLLDLAAEEVHGNKESGAVHA